MSPNVLTHLSFENMEEDIKVKRVLLFDLTTEPCSSKYDKCDCEN